LSNIYLNAVDMMLERAQAVTREGQGTHVEYARFADDLVVLVDGHPRHHWLGTAIERRLREEFATLQVAVNEDKRRNVDLTQGEGFGFLGFECRRVRSGRGDGCRGARRNARSGRRCCGRSSPCFEVIDPGPSQR